MTIPSKIIKYPSVAKGGDERMFIDFLEKAKVKYELIKHRQVFTAQDKAATLKVKPNIIGKTLVLKIDKRISVVLIPANKNLDKNKFSAFVKHYGGSAVASREGGKKVAKALPTACLPDRQGRQVKNLDFVSERIMKNQLKGVKVGAIPPFGNLWDFSTFVDKSLTLQPKIIVNSGDHNWSIKISPAVFKKLIPDLIIGNFSKFRK